MDVVFRGLNHRLAGLSLSFFFALLLLSGLMPASVSAREAAARMDDAPSYGGDYTLHLIDNQGDEVFREVIANAVVAGGNEDPLSDQFRSPFVSRYLYFDTLDEARQNAGTPTTWEQADIYVGYESTLSADQPYAVWAANRYMHATFKPQQSHERKANQEYYAQSQSYDVGNVRAGFGYARNPVSTTTLPFVDNNYMWELGDDPYRITLHNKANHWYCNPTTNNPAHLDLPETGSTGTYSYVYWKPKNGAVDKNGGYGRLYYRGSTSRTLSDTDNNNLYVMGRGSSDGDWVAGDISNGNYGAGAKIYIQTLPSVAIHVVNAKKEVECTLQAYYKSGATMPAFTPYYLWRAYTKDHRFYYDEALQDPIAQGVQVSEEKMAASPHVYVTYDLDSDWNSDNLFKLYPDDDEEEETTWYSVQISSNYTRFLSVSTAADKKVGNVQDGSKSLNTYDSTKDNQYWALSGTPYNLRLISKYHGKDYLLGVKESLSAGLEPSLYGAADAEALTSWELLQGLSADNNYTYLRLQKSFNGENSARSVFYLSYNGASPYNTILSNTASQNQQQIFTKVTTTGGVVQPVTEYTLKLIDKSNTEVFEVKVTADDVSQANGDPLPSMYRSPFAENYRYYTTQDEACNNSGTPKDWTDEEQTTVYVGYDVKRDLFAADKSFAIMGGGKYMHSVFRYADNATALYSMQMQKYDACYVGGNNYSANEVTTTTLPFVDNTYMWQLGDDPYNVKLRNKANGWYCAPQTATSSATFTSTDGGHSYSLLYWQGDASAPYYIIRYRDAAEKYVVATNSDNGDWRLYTRESNLTSTDRWEMTKFYVEELPAVDVHILNAADEVESTLQGYFKSGATMPAFTPFNLRRAYTDNHQFYYSYDSAAQNEPIAAGTEVDGSKVGTDIYVKYTLSADWHTVDETNKEHTTEANQATTTLKSYQPGDAEINWYGLRAAGDDDDFLTVKTEAVPSELERSKRAAVVGDTPSPFAHWAVVGTPYSLRLVERSHGEAYSLGIPEAAVNNDMAYLYKEPADGVLSVWEVLPMVPGTSAAAKLFLRPQGALNGAAPQLFPGWNGGGRCPGVGNVVSKNYGLDLTWAAATPAKSVTFKLYDREGAAMDVADVRVTGVVEGESLSDLFAATTLPRRYCTYSFYADDTFETPLEQVGSEAAATIYTRWDYSDDAPVFSQGTDPYDYQYYLLDVGSETYRWLCSVEGDADTGYTFTNSSLSEPVKGSSRQFALVGTPYGFRFYSRYAQCSVGLDDGKLVLDGNADGEVVFDLPQDNSLQSTQLKMRNTATGKYLYALAGANFLDSSPQRYVQLCYIVVPVCIFKDGQTAYADRVDECEYALSLNVSGGNSSNTIPVAVDSRITDDMLNADQNAWGTTFDFRHAFCNYVFYYGYDRASGQLSNPIPTAGSDAGLPYYGGNEQYRRAFFGTYTVDEEDFGRVYLFSNTSSAATRLFFGKGAETTAATGEEGAETALHYFALTSVTTETAARNDENLTYRWMLTGDPYDLQLVNLSTGNNYLTMPLGVKNVSDRTASPTQANGQLAMLTDDEDYAVASRWEVIARSDGSYRFYAVGDGADDRYARSLRLYQYNKAELIVNDIHNDLMLTPAVLQHPVVWQVVDEQGHDVAAARYVHEKVSEGQVLTIDDMPGELQRQFCEYTLYYADYDAVSGQYPAFSDAATAPLPDDGLTVGNACIVYAQYHLEDGAPVFYESTAAYEQAADDAKERYNVRFDRTTYLYDDTTGGDAEGRLRVSSSKESTETGTYSKWVLVGTPYAVRFYNPTTGHSLSLGSTIAPGNPLATTSGEGNRWTLLKDNTGNKAAVCLWEENGMHMLYVSDNGTMDIQTGAELARGVEFVGNNGVDGLTFRLHYGAASLRPDADTPALITLADYVATGRKLDHVLPVWWKRAFCNYRYSYGDDDVDAVTMAMANAGGPVVVDVYYDVESDFRWSSQTAAGDASDLHWYYLVNHHWQGIGQGGMLFKTSERRLRWSEDYVPTRLYTNNYEWCLIGDPYGFRVLGHYDPDQYFDQYLSVGQDDDVETIQADDAAWKGNLFEMCVSKWNGHFWMHPIQTDDQRQQMAGAADGTAPTVVSSVGVNINYPVLNSARYADVSSATTRNVRVTELSPVTVAEYVKYAGFVGALSNEAVAADEGVTLDDGTFLSLSTIQDKVEQGQTLTDDEVRYVHAKMEEKGDDGSYANIREMKRGYYRLVPYIYEKGEMGQTAARVYLRGYLNGPGTGSNAEWHADGAATNKALMINEAEASAAYDPATIFYFEPASDDEGHVRYRVSTQGMNLAGSQLRQGEGNLCRYENLGGMLAQLRTAEGSNGGYDYLSYVQNFGNREPEDARRSAMRNTFEMYNSTRFYLQPVGDGHNEMAFRTKLNSGHSGTPLASCPFTYTSVYVPFDLLIVGGKDADGQLIDDASQADVVPFVGVYEKFHQSWSLSGEFEGDYFNANEYTLLCQSVDLFNRGEHENDPRFIPAGTPVLLRSKSGMTDIKFVIPSDTPDAANSIAENQLSGTYLSSLTEEQKDPAYYVFGKESKTVNGKKTYTGRVGLFPRANPQTKALTANKVYYLSPQHGSATSKQMVFEFQEGDAATGPGTATGVRELTGPQADASVYDLQGRRVERPVRPGVYIVNGQKMVLR